MLESSPHKCFVIHDERDADWDGDDHDEPIPACGTAWWDECTTETEPKEEETAWTDTLYRR